MKVTCLKCKRHIRLRKSRNMRCVCGYVFPFAQVIRTERVFLLDANIIIFSLDKDPVHGRDCTGVLLLGHVATTEQVLAEIHQPLELSIQVYKVKMISPELKEMHSNAVKQPSDADLSLIQAALDHPEIGGIIHV